MKNTHGRVLLLVKVAGFSLPKLTLIHGCFSRFLNSKTGTKSRIGAHIKEDILVLPQTLGNSNHFRILNLASSSAVSTTNTMP